MSQKIRYCIFVILSLLLFTACSKEMTKKEVLAIEKKEQALGQVLFFDTILSKNNNQSCATCHNPNFGFIDNRNNGVLGAGSLGDDLKSIGKRNAPSVAYARYSPTFHYDKKKKQFVGGQFWDGRAKHLKAQAGGPLLNKIEMGMLSKEDIVNRLESTKSYNEKFIDIYGKNIFKNTSNTYNKMTQAIALFETTKEFAPFDSKYDRYLKGDYDLSPIEDLGRSIFFSNNNTNCSSCHVLKKEDSLMETFTNYQYHNIGVPKNKLLMTKNVVNPQTFIDHGLMNNPEVKNLPNAIDFDGKMKVPSLRNIAITAPYMHNGKFQKLSTVIKFYDKYTNENRTLNPETNKPWEDPEVVISNEDKKLLTGGKALSDRKADALLAFMNLLTDKKYEHLIKENN